MWVWNICCRRAWFEFENGLVDDFLAIVHMSVINKDIEDKWIDKGK